MTDFGQVRPAGDNDDGEITMQESRFVDVVLQLVEVRPEEFRGVASPFDSSLVGCPSGPIVDHIGEAVQAATTFVAGVGEVALDGSASLNESELVRFLINEELTDKNWAKAWKYFLDSKFTDFTFVFGKEVELNDVFLDDFNVSIKLLRLGSERVGSKITLKKKAGFFNSEDGHSAFTAYFDQAKSFEVS